MGIIDRICKIVDDFTGAAETMVDGVTFQGKPENRIKFEEDKDRERKERDERDRERWKNG